MPRLGELVYLLEKEGFQILVYQHACFDVAAKRKTLSLLIKVLGNIDGLRPDVAEELKRLSACVSAFPLVVGESSKAGRLSNAVYERFGVPSMNLSTLTDCLDGSIVPRSSQGRELAEPDPARMRELREGLGMSRKQLGERVGISQQSVYLAEKEGMRFEARTLHRIERVLHEPVAKETSPFAEPKVVPPAPASGLERKLASFDFDVFPFSRTGFDVLAKDEKNRVVVRESVPRDLSRIEGFSEFFSALLALVSERPEKRAPVVLREELEGIKTKREFLRLLREKQVAG
ncbi:helix-turn-helix domain-containing protein [Candidatus Micrarchaeota archaeon]|nr:helix-turn-helix domain-containing protein [Candidatus Micrarchaeota archaeon]